MKVMAHGYLGRWNGRENLETVYLSWSHFEVKSDQNDHMRYRERKNGLWIQDHASV